MILEIKNCSFGYTNSNPILKEISFSIKKGELISILGPNGSGKTSLIKCITGIENFNSGTLLLNKKDITTNMNRGKSFAYVPQLIGNPVSFTVMEMVLLGRSRFTGNFTGPSKLDIEVVNKTINEVGISHLKSKSFSTLSGGERQMVLIARALASEAEIFIFDEPTSALDLVHQHRALDLMVKLSKYKGYTLIFTTHDPTHALHISNKSLLMSKNGEVIFDKTIDVITPKKIKKVFHVDTKILDFQGFEGRMDKVVVPLLS